MELNRFQQEDLSGGVQNKSIDSIANGDQVLHAQNGEFTSKVGACTGRLGSDSVSAVVTDKQVLNLFQYVNSSNARQYFALSNDASDANSDILVSGVEYDGAWAVSLADRVASRDGWAENFANKMAFFNGVDAPQWWDGSAWSVMTNAPTSGKFPVVFNQRLYALSQDGYLHYSDVINDTGTDFTTTEWLFRGINPNEGQICTMAKRHRGRIVIFKTESIYRYDGTNEPEAVITVGTHSGRSVVVLKDLFFHHPTGIYRMGLDEPVNISRAVQKYLDGMSSANWSNVAAGRDTENVYFWIGDVTIDDPLAFDWGETYRDVVLVWNVYAENWTVYTGWNARVWTYDESTGTAYFGQANGQVIEVGVGYADVRAGGLVTPISWKVIFRPRDFGFPEKDKETNLIHVSGKFTSQVMAGSSYEDMINREIFAKDGATVRDKIVFKELWVGVAEEYMEELPRVEGLVVDNINLLDNAQ